MDKDLRLTEAVYLLAEIEERYMHRTGKPTPSEIIASILQYSEEKQEISQRTYGD